MSTQDLRVPLDIFSDPICPWCYIGKSRLQAALAEHGNPFHIRWRTFQLNPEMPPGGMNRRTYLMRKFGEAEADRFYQSIEQTAKADGLPVRFDLIARTPSTLDAHRLVRWSTEGQQQSDIVDALFTAYFCQGRDIGKRDELAQIAGKAGHDASQTLQRLQSTEDVDAIQNDDEQGRKLGIGGVPFFVLNGQQAISGAQPPQIWADVIQQVKTQLAAK